MPALIDARTWIGAGLGDPAGISRQADEVAALFAAFVTAARRSLDIAIYDFRLDAQRGAAVMGALNAIAARGVSVRVAYFDPPPKKNARADGGDPTPGMTAGDLKSLHPRIARKPIQGIDIEDLPKGVVRQPIEGGGHLMHSKYMIRDLETVWTGSANFTTDAWSIQDNNVLQIESPGIARCYATDFEELWASGRIAGTGKNDLGQVEVGGEEVDVAFSPGEGSTVEKEIAGAIQGARQSVAIASMVISSGAILGALTDAIARGVSLSGVYDGPEMNVVLRGWAKGTKSAGKAEQWKRIGSRLIAKASKPYAPKAPHDFMHNKLAVVDRRLLVTGSFNFSQNATLNAENLLTLRDPDLVGQYADYVDRLVAFYGKAGSTRTAAGVKRAARHR